MATKQRLRELAYSDLQRECNLYEVLCGEVQTRMASSDELTYYKNLALKNRKKMANNFSYKKEYEI